MLYIGMTSGLRQRMKAPKAFMDAQDAKDREKLLKGFGGSYRNLMQRIRRSRLGVLTPGGAG